MAEREDVAAEMLALLDAHVPAADWHCSCGLDVFGGSAAYSRKLGESHVAGVLGDWLAAHDERVRADERERLAGKAGKPGGYYATLRSMTRDPKLLKAVDDAERKDAERAQRTGEEWA